MPEDAIILGLGRRGQDDPHLPLILRPPKELCCDSSVDKVKKELNTLTTSSVLRLHFVETSERLST
jgi:hypothetical protein